MNPVTVCVFWQIIKDTKTKAIIHTGAASSLGKMLVKLCQANDIQILNVVRKEEQVKQLKDLGAEYVVNSSLESYQEDLVKAIDELKPSSFFDCVGGELSSNILLKMPRFSTLYIYGSLDPTGLLSFGNRDIIGGRKVIKSCFASDLQRGMFHLLPLNYK